MRPRRLLILITLLTVLTAGFASAASLGGLGAASLGAGTSAVAACDSNGMTVKYTTSGGKVTGVTVEGIADPGCEGARLSLTLTDTASTSIGSASTVTIPADADTIDNSLSVSVSPQPNAELVAGVHISVIGP